MTNRGSRMGRYLLFLFAAPWSLTVGWGWVLLLALAGAARNLRWEPTGVLTAVWRDWAARRWRYSTTLGRGIIYQENDRAAAGEPWTSIQQHEHVHVRQVEDAMLLSLVLGAVVYGVTANLWLGLSLWWSGGGWQLPNFATAWLRGGDPYRDSEHERAAYAETGKDADGVSWLGRRAV